jgi:plastocyanin
VRHLYCEGVISGYADGTFRPYNNTTRGQMAKIVIIAFDYPIYIPPTPTFTDVPPTDPFYQYIETAAFNNIVSGYSDGTYRPYNNVTRGQLSKIVVVAADWALENPPTPTFSDVPTTDPFYTYIETAYCHEIITGYADGTFRPGENATRAQISKIVSLAMQNAGQCGAAQVDIENYLYVPQSVTISAGEAVRWTNIDKVGHTATSVTPGMFDSGNLGQGESWQFTFNTTGVYEYLCTPHPWMTGTITVQ